MKNVRYVYEADDNFIGKAIRWFTNGRVNHVALTYDSDDWDTVVDGETKRAEWVVEAIPKGTVSRPVRNRKWTHVVTPKYDAIPYLKAAQEFVDRKYEFKAIFLFAIFILAWRWFRLKLRRPTLAGKAQICSELAAHTVLPILGPAIENPQWVHPEELLLLQEAYPEHFDVRKMDDE